jgi:hypothetical protein
MTADDLSAHPRYLLLAGGLAMAGLLTALVHHVWFTPYTMVLFMMAGQGLILLAAGCFLYAVWSGVRARLRSIVEKKFKAGDIVFRRGDGADRLYVIGQGEVELVRETPGKKDVVLSIHRNYFTSLFSYLPMLREKVLSAYQERTERDR